MSWLHIFPLLAASAATVAVNEAPIPAGNPENAELIKLQQERYERVTVPVTIKGQGPFRFMVDTGAQATVVSSALADRLGLTERSPATVVGMASRAAVQITEIPQLGLGSREFYIRSAPILEAQNLGGADGILGLDSLQDQRVLIDFEKQRIFVADAKQLGGDRGYEIVVKARRKLGQLIITGARLNGIDVDVIVDTGSQSSVGNMALFERMSRTRGIGNNTLTDVNGHDLTSASKDGPEARNQQNDRELHSDNVRRCTAVSSAGNDQRTGADSGRRSAQAVPPRGNRLPTAAHPVRSAARSE